MTKKSIINVLLKDSPSSVEAVKRYVDFCFNEHDPASGGDWHHVASQGMHPEHADTEGNQVCLPVPKHVWAHYLLALAFPNDFDALWAFNMMMNLAGDTLIPDGGYAEADVFEAGVALAAAREKMYADPKWQAATAAANKKMAADPKWQAATAAAIAKRTADPNWQAATAAANKKMAADPNWQAANAAAQKRRRENEFLKTVAWG